MVSGPIHRSLDAGRKALGAGLRTPPALAPGSRLNRLGQPVGELRRQAGTISEEDYARERARTEQILRELVRG